MNERQSLRIGMVGAGYIAGIHSAAYRTAAGAYADLLAGHVQLVRVADLDLARASRLGASWGFADVTDDWRTVTRGDDVDIVDIVVPNAMHAQIAIDALAHDKHVICEKPLSTSVATAREMCVAADASRGLAQVCFYYRVWPAIAWARQLLDDGLIGEIIRFRGEMLQDYASDPAHLMGWRTDPAQAGAGALGDLGSHIIDVARYLAGDITRLTAFQQTFVERSGALPVNTPVDDLTSIFVEFESGASGVLEASWALPGHKCNLAFEIVGRCGAIRFSWERSNEIHLMIEGEAHGGFQRVLVGPESPGAAPFMAVAGQGLGYHDAFTIGLGSMLRAVSSDSRTVAPSFVDGLQACEIVAAAQASAESGTWTAVNRADTVMARV